MTSSSKCILQPGIRGLSENITVRSLVGRFLEHSRIYHSESVGTPITYLSSADWMDRNCISRVEVAFLIEDSRLQRRVVSEGLNNYLKDSANSWVLKKHGDYERVSTKSTKTCSAQQYLLKKLFNI